MSTNFYLHRDPQNCGECGKPGREAEIHIGKRSGGWVFSWQGFEAEESPSGSPLYDFETWRAFLMREIASGAQIKDEYHQKYTSEGFFAEVESLRGQRRRSVEYPDDGRVRAAGPDDVSYGTWF
jgi:hypothetical protein